MRTLLIVDDDQAIRRSLALSFRKEFQILEAAAGEEALEIIKETQVDIVLLDQFPVPHGRRRVRWYRR